ncbi:MAG TPA: hypothetical protein VIJ64_13340 [Candidatus Lustribacter sp.]
MHTQEIQARTAAELYALDPDYVTLPEGRMPLTRTAFWSLIALRVYLIALIVLVGYRFTEYAHLVK